MNQDHRKETEYNRPCDSFVDNECGFCVLCSWNKRSHEDERLRLEKKSKANMKSITVAVTLHSSATIELEVKEMHLDWKRRVMENLVSITPMREQAIKEIEKQFPGTTVGHFSFVEFVEEKGESR